MEKMITLDFAFCFVILMRMMEVPKKFSILHPSNRFIPHKNPYTILKGVLA